MVGMYGIREAYNGFRRVLIASLSLGTLLLSSPTYSQEPEVSRFSRDDESERGRIECVHGVDFKSKYVTMRGISYSDGPVFQAFGNYGWKDFSLTHWYDVELGKERPLREIDLDLHYEKEIGGGLKAKAGFMEAYLPYEDFLFLHSLYGELGCNGPVNLACYLNRDWYGKDRGWLGKIKAGKSFPLGNKIDLRLAAEMTYNHGDFRPVSDFSHASISGSISFDIGPYNLKLSGYYQEPLNRHFGRESWVGVGISR